MATLILKAHSTGKIDRTSGRIHASRAATIGGSFGEESGQVLEQVAWSLRYDKRQNSSVAASEFGRRRFSGYAVTRWRCAPNLCRLSVLAGIVAGTDDLFLASRAPETR